MFAEEQPALGPLPLEPFRYYRYGERTVHLDGCVEVEAAYYGAPPGWIGRRVHVQWNDLHVRLLAPTTGQLLREHLRAPRGWHRLHDEDRPARTPSSTIALLTRANTAGAHISAVCTYIHQPVEIRAQEGLRILGFQPFLRMFDTASDSLVQIGTANGDIGFHTSHSLASGDVHCPIDAQEFWGCDDDRDLVRGDRRDPYWR